MNAANRKDPGLILAYALSRPRAREFTPLHLALVHVALEFECPARIPLAWAGTIDLGPGLGEAHIAAVTSALRWQRRQARRERLRAAWGRVRALLRAAEAGPWHRAGTLRF